jgi:peroxiredoxin
VLFSGDRVPRADFARQTGWVVEPGRARKGDIDQSIPADAIASDDTLDIAVIAEILGMPIVTDAEHGVSAVGPETGVGGRVLTTVQAPELELPTFTGGTFALSSLLGTRVVMVAWASWCGCAFDLPRWQEIRESVRPRGIEIVTVAMDAAGPAAGRRFIERAAPQHPSLIDETHLLGRLLGVMNVPSGIWIDEDGVIVRPPEPAFPGAAALFDEVLEPGRADAIADGRAPSTLRHLLREQQELTPEVLERLDFLRRIAEVTEPELYLEMVLDWADNGADCSYVLPADEVLARSAPRSEAAARAVAHFELGQYLHRSSDHVSAVGHWREAHRLQPENWTYKRQAWHLEASGESPYESSMERDLRMIGPENYYPRLQP